MFEEEGGAQAPKAPPPRKSCDYHAIQIVIIYGLFRHCINFLFKFKEWDYRWNLTSTVVDQSACDYSLQWKVCNHELIGDCYKLHVHINNPLCGRGRMKLRSNNESISSKRNRKKHFLSKLSFFLLTCIVLETKTSTLEGLKFSLEDHMKVSAQPEPSIVASGLANCYVPWLDSLFD